MTHKNTQEKYHTQFYKKNMNTIYKMLSNLDADVYIRS